jgi:hypothetical protein
VIKSKVELNKLARIEQEQTCKKILKIRKNQLQQTYEKRKQLLTNL